MIRIYSMVRADAIASQPLEITLPFGCSQAHRSWCRNIRTFNNVYKHPNIVRTQLVHVRPHVTTRDTTEAYAFTSKDDAFRAAWGISKRFGHRQTLLDRQIIDLQQVNAWRNELREYMATYGISMIKCESLSWEAIVKLGWIAAYADLQNDVREVFIDNFLYAVRKKIDKEDDEGISVKLTISLLSVGRRLDTRGQLARELISSLSIDFSSFNAKYIIQYIHLLDVLTNNDVEFTNLLSERISCGLLSMLNPIEFSSVLDNVARTKWTASPRHKNEILTCALKMRVHLDSMTIVSLVQIMTRLPQADDKCMEAVSEIVSGSMNRFPMKDLGLIAKQYAILTSRNPRNDTFLSMLSMIAEQTAACIDGADPKDLVRLIQAFQIADFKPDTLLDVLDIWADKRLASMNAQGISLAMTHFARVGEASPRLLKTAVSVIESNLDQLTASDASKLIWSFAHLAYHPGEKLLDKCLHYLQSSSAVKEISDREMANLFWGLVKLEHYPSDEERLKIASSLYSSPGRISGQSSALILWSFASSQEAVGGIHGNKCFESTIYRLALELCSDIMIVDSQSISMTSWSLGVLQVTHKDFSNCLDSIASEGKLLAFDPQHISNLLWGLAKSGSIPSHQFISEITGVLAGKLSMYSPQEIFNICWSFATLRFDALSLIGESVIELKTRSTEFQGLEISGIAWSLGKMLSSRYEQHTSNLEIREKACIVLQRELRKHIEELEMSQLAMALVGIARISSPNSSKWINSDLIDTFVEKIDSFLHQKRFTIGSVNAFLEGMILLSVSLSASLADTLESTITESMLAESKLWEVCDLCYYTGELKIVTLSKRLLGHIDGRVANGEGLTPRASIMLLQTMVQCKWYPMSTLHTTTTKLSSMSPKYVLNDKWMRQLVSTRPKLAPDAQILLSFHPDWESRLHKLEQEF